MKIGVAGDSMSLTRVVVATFLGGIVLGGVGYLFDLVIGPLIQMHGWWTVFAGGGFILGGMLQAAREFTVPLPAERQAVAARLKAQEAQEAEEAREADADAADPGEPAASTKD